jgi:hypothetical protein
MAGKIDGFILRCKSDKAFIDKHYQKTIKLAESYFFHAKEFAASYQKILLEKGIEAEIVPAQQIITLP